MGPKEDFLALFNRFAAEKKKDEPPLSCDQLKNRISKDHEEMMRLLNSEEALSRELTKKSL